MQKWLSINTSKVSKIVMNIIFIWFYYYICLLWGLYFSSIFYYSIADDHDSLVIILNRYIFYMLLQNQAVESIEYWILLHGKAIIQSISVMRLWNKALMIMNLEFYLISMKQVKYIICLPISQLKDILYRLKPIERI